MMPSSQLHAASARRVVIWSHELHQGLVEQLHAGGIEVVALVQGQLEGLPCFSLHELFYGSAALEAASASSAPPLLQSDDEFRVYARCIARLGFAPMTTRYYSYFGASISASDLEDWAQLHLKRALRLLLGLRVDEVWFFAVPHLGLDNQMALAARVLGLTVFEFRQSPFAGKFFVDAWVGAQALDLPEVGQLPWRGTNAAPNMFYMQDAQPRRLWKAWSERLGSTFLALSGKHRASFLERLYREAGSRRWWWLVGLLERCDPHLRPFSPVRRAQRKQLVRDRAARRVHVPAPDSPPFVYFPLHYEPEANTSVFGGDYFSQITALEAVHSRLPPSWIVLIKENPKQLFLHRGEPFYQRINMLPNAFFVPDQCSSAELIQSARLVASVSGTATYESMLTGRSALYFGNPWYRELPGAERFHPELDLLAVSKRRLAPQDLLAALQALLSTALDGVVQPRFLALFGAQASWTDQLQRTAQSLLALSHSVRSQATKVSANSSLRGKGESSS